MNNQPNKYLTLTITTLSSFMTPFMGSSVNVALPAIGSEFSLDAVLLSWVATSYLLAAAVFLLPFGRIADIVGRKKIYLTGIIIYASASLLSGMATGGYFLIIARIFQGVGGSLIFGTGVAILSSVFPEKERGKALGINVAAVYLGLSAGPFIGGVITEQLGWRYLFFLNALMGAVVIILVILKLHGEWAEARGEKFDLPGALIYGVGILGVMYGFSELPQISGFIYFGIGIAALAFFLWWEKRSPSPILNIFLFRRNKAFIFSNLAAFIHYSATFGISFLMSLFLQYIKDYNPQEAGTILVAQPIMMAIFSPVAGRLSDKLEPRYVASTGMAVTGAGLLIFSFIDKSTSLSFIIINLLMIGFGYAFFSSPNTNAIMSSVTKKYFGVASATMATMRLTGQTLSMGLIMLVFSTMIGKVEITPAYYPQFLISVRTAFAIFAALSAGGVISSMARGKIRA